MSLELGGRNDIDNVIDKIISHYSGYALFQRLNFYGLSGNRELQTKIYERLVKLAKESAKSTTLYEEYRKKLHRLKPDSPLVIEDPEWIAKTDSEFEQVTSSLDSAVRTHAENQEYKEASLASIEIGMLYINNGDLIGAQRYFRRALDLSGSNYGPRRFPTVTGQSQLRLAEISILTKQWSIAKSQIHRSLPVDNNGKLKLSQIQLDSPSIVGMQVIYSIACLGIGDFEECAGSFLKIGEGLSGNREMDSVEIPRASKMDTEGTGFEVRADQRGEKVNNNTKQASTFSDNEDLTVSAEYLEKVLESSQVMKFKDIGPIVTVCSLATFSRQHLRFMIDKDSLYSTFIEETPYLRNLVSSFLSLKLDGFFALWSAHSSSFEMDPYLGPHLNSLYLRIKERAYGQYLSVFKSVPLESMQQLFSEGQSAIDGLSSYIEKSGSDMRVDQLNNVVSTAPQNQYLEVYTKSESVSADFIHDSYGLIWGVNCMDLPSVPNVTN
ncbi:hypothetical protein AWJ20_3248 [Sugiyamaella lignohabitans]|uniref:Uncharacterized protein n=1 Tax=Sugiyamaella lignohabitans TaxID=796027 RepID=A0A167FRI7_9ASCO|nr:uncharacterized protein AWJ20_3248 [Sugiyamaella lignohabitans]ANB15611.1 hypothetical protein AWJ20_3248 [Sugiyamaella lignohabitans]